ncbi:MAG: hypothetical protein ACKVRO_19320 [Micropepsaceae bacterium]
MRMGLFTLLILAAIGALIYFGVKGRMVRLREEFAEALRRAQGKRAEKLPSESMVACPTCGTYAAAGQQKNCGKQGCPYA